MSHGFRIQIISCVTALIFICAYFLAHPITGWCAFILALMSIIIISVETYQMLASRPPEEPNEKILGEVKELRERLSSLELALGPKRELR